MRAFKFRGRASIERRNIAAVVAVAASGGKNAPSKVIDFIRDTNRISTRFFFCVQNMSQCVQYQKPGQTVGVSVSVFVTFCALRLFLTFQLCMYRLLD